jgi:hypothetical protein
MIRDNAKRVYVSGPYSRGDVEWNVLEAMRIGNLIMLAGHAPFVPHLTHHFHAKFPHDYSTWLAVDLVFLSVCDALYRIPGYSVGADVEVMEALRLGIPVICTEDELEVYLDDGVEVA